MGFFWLVLYLTAVAIAMLQAVLVGMQAWEHRRFARSRLANVPWYGVKGRAVLFVPCRGGDVGLERNLDRLYRQDYGDYEVHFIIEGPDDPVWPLLRRVAARHPRITTRVVMAGKAGATGQKVHNLRVATSQLDPSVCYLAFVDADARPADHWLRAMLARLDGHGVGAVTGYRWFVPRKNSLANVLLYSINCGVASLLGKKGPNHVWGGSWVIRRTTFDAIGLRGAWEGTLSDDLVASRVLRDAGYRVEFEPAAMVQSPLDYRFGEMLAFLRRQYVIGRFYTPGLWAFGLAMTTLANAVLFGSLAAAACGLFGAGGGAAFWVPAVGFVLLYGSTVFRAVVRQDAAMIYFPQLRGRLRIARWFDMCAAPLFGLVNWLGLATASVGCRIAWRGITYRLDRKGQVRLVGRDDGLPLAPPADADQPPATLRHRKAG